ncbi:MAG: hydrogenobyrinic acid a,c-diamide synthase (glutamine-hydrolyzing) [Methanoregulaceae archaeon]|nr:hydrogenobyrinic acid a,c-diamide synthase (glutamine-hydrolyzing) [Methanoregulaceae archaeon]
MSRSCPRLVMAALRGSAGKTTLCVALAAALAKRGRRVAPFKKGPDYIDAAWLSLAASSPCYNLDTFMMGREQVFRSFSHHAPESAISLIEGNRGLYDGLTPRGEHSTAELAKLIKAPVILVVDCDKVTRTMAAMVLGCQRFDPEVDIRGVILNRVAGSRHAAVVRSSVEDCCHLPVFGTVPRIADIPFAERHLGLIPPQEHDRIRRALSKAADMAGDYLDLEGLIQTAESAPSLEDNEFPDIITVEKSAHEPVSIGVIRDRAFQFYYPENIQALTDKGARVIEISALDEKRLPAVDALYIGGGFPETQARLLAENKAFRRSLRYSVEEGLPTYAECGGFMFLGESLTIGDHHYPMVGVLPVVFGMEKRPQGHGYTVLEVDRENPFFPVGTRLRGHEFHYSRILSWKTAGEELVFRVKRGVGIDGKRDGLCRKNVLSTFTHLHALGTPEWAEGLVGRARQYRDGRQDVTKKVQNGNRLQIIEGGSRYAPDRTGRENL